MINYDLSVLSLLAHNPSPSPKAAVPRALRHPGCVWAGGRRGCVLAHGIPILHWVKYSDVPQRAFAASTHKGAR